MKTIELAVQLISAYIVNKDLSVNDIIKELKKVNNALKMIDKEKEEEFLDNWTNKSEATESETKLSENITDNQNEIDLEKVTSTEGNELLDVNTTETSTTPINIDENGQRHKRAYHKKDKTVIAEKKHRGRPPLDKTKSKKVASKK